MLADRPVTATRAALAPPPVDCRGSSLFFDFDGTLVDLAPAPDAVVVPDALRVRLARLAAAFPGRVAIVSGRSIAQLDGFLGEDGAPFALAGSHGAELRLAGQAGDAIERPGELDAVDAAFDAFATRNGLIFERKTFGSALHFRAAPAFEEEAVALARTLVADGALVLQRGKMMVEVRRAGDKGAALTRLLDMPAMAGSKPLFFGDDVTDEDGFQAAARAGGAGVLIGEDRPTSALYGLPSVASLGTWIDAVLETL